MDIIRAIIKTACTVFGVIIITTTFRKESTAGQTYLGGVIGSILISIGVNF